MTVFASAVAIDKSVDCVEPKSDLIDGVYINKGVRLYKNEEPFENVLRLKFCFYSLVLRRIRFIKRKANFCYGGNIFGSEEPFGCYCCLIGNNFCLSTCALTETFSKTKNLWKKYCA